MKKINNIILTYQTRGLFKLLLAIYYNLKCIFYKFFKIKYLKKKIYGNSMFLDLNDPGISRTLILFGERELDHKYILEKILQQNMIVLDIGANIGYYALIQLNKININGYLIAVEPSPKNFQILNKNLKENFLKNYEVHNLAISNEIKFKELYLSNSSNLNTFHNSNDIGLNLSGEKITVQTSTILSIAKSRKIDLIRMDVEGHEVKILDSVLEYIKISKQKPMILFEPHLTRYSKENDLIKPLTKLFELNYFADYVASSWIEGSYKVINKGYKETDKIKTDGVERMIFRNISENDMVDLLTKEGGLRSVLLTPNKHL